MHSFFLFIIILLKPSSTAYVSISHVPCIAQLFSFWLSAYLSLQYWSPKDHQRSPLNYCNLPSLASSHMSLQFLSWSLTYFQLMCSPCFLTNQVLHMLVPFPREFSLLYIAEKPPAYTSNLSSNIISLEELFMTFLTE